MRKCVYYGVFDWFLWLSNFKAIIKYNNCHYLDVCKKCSEWKFSFNKSSESSFWDKTTFWVMVKAIKNMTVTYETELTKIFNV